MNMSSIDKLINELFCKLELLLKEHEELTDTDVREALHYVLTYYFIWGNKQRKLPISYAMFTHKGDEEVALVVNAFISELNLMPELKELSLGQERLNILQNKAIVTSEGRQYDDFIGHVNKPLVLHELPEYFFEEGDYDE